MIEKNSSYIKAGRDAIGNTSNSEDIKVVAAGTISGSVNNAIAQLKESNSLEAQQLAEKLIQLQAVIEEDQNLQPEDKEEALEQVKVLAEAATNPDDGKMIKAAKTATKILKGTVATIPLATELVHGVNQLLPAIADLLHLG